MTSSDWSSVTKEGPPPYFAFQKPIQKSQQDDRDYRLIRLENGLHAMLVHDVTADKAAASLDVAVGHLYDPDDMPGLAHFCEHLLFMGTEQFPRENEYSEFLAKNSGSSNAFTSTCNTNYYFNVATAALPPALARFAAFFHCPLFSPSCTSRELNAVDSEHKKNLQSDIWRIYQVNKLLSKEGHVWKKFGSGNRESLSQAAKLLKEKDKLNSSLLRTSLRPVSAAPSPIPSRTPSPAPSVASHTSDTESDGGYVGRETRRRLVEWWSKEYCASRMRLCVVGKESLDELADLVSTLFSPIQNRGREPLPMLHEHPFGPNEKATLVSVQTIMSFHAVEISFPLGYQPPLWRHKPANFITFFIGHEGPGSLHSYLKNKGWLTSLGAGTQNLARGFAMFKVTVQLTNEGFLNHQSVIMATFKYLSLLRSSPFPAWCQEEQAKLSTIRFRFSEKRRPDDYATSLTEHMTWPVPPELLLSAPRLVWEWDAGDAGEKEVRDILETMRIDQGRAVLMARADEYTKICPPTTQWEKEPWYGTPYRVEKFDDSFIREAQGPNDILELRLPGPNEFIPSNLDVDKLEEVQPLKRPHLIHKTPISTVWYKKDDRFWVPKAHVGVDIHTPLANDSPRNSVLTRLFTDLVEDSLTEFAYDAELAGLTYSISTASTGVVLGLSGYNDKISVLCKHVVEKIANFSVDPERLKVMKEQLKRDWINSFLGQSHRVSDYHARHTLTHQSWTIEESLPEIPSVTAEELQTHAVKLLSKVHMTHLMTGNISKDEAIGIVETIETVLGSSAMSSRLYDRALILPRGSNTVWVAPVPNPKEPNSALSYYVHVGRMTDPRTRVTLALLAQILAEPAFNILRTKEQLGYVVSCSRWYLAGASDAGIRVLVQSEKNPAYLEKRVEAFLEHMKSVIEEMGIEEFNEQKVGLQRKWREAHKNLREEMSSFWVHLDSGHLDFYRRERDAQLLEEITKEEVMSLFLQHIHPLSPTRSKFSIHLMSQKPPPPQISIAAAEAFEEMVRNSELLVDEDGWEWRKELSNKGTALLDEFVKHWTGALGEQSGVQELLQALPKLVEANPVPAEVTPEGVVFVKNLEEFRQSLKVSDVAGPLVEWGDFPTAKF